MARFASLRLLYVVLLVTGWAQLALGSALAANESNSRVAIILTFRGAVTPVLDRYIEDGINAAVARNAELVVLQLDTPGGSVEVTKAIIQRMLAAPKPIAVYVAPSGAHAGSAGTFVTLAGHVAAMAPGSSIGAASPIASSGEEIDATLQAKIKNILSADIENLAQRRGDKAVEWAIAAVQNAAAATAVQARDLGVIDFIAVDLADLLRQMNGFVVTVQGDPVTLDTGDMTPVPLELTPLQQFLNLIANPTIATILITVGSAGLLAEVWNPGTWAPGVIGAICLLLGLYALGQLDANFAGLALMALGLVLFVAEAFTPTFGALLTAGLVAFVLGAMLLFDVPGIAVPWPTIVALAVALGGFSFLVATKALAAQRRPVLTGGEGLLGHKGYAKQAFASGQVGSVFVNGEWWNAELEAGSVAEGDDVQVVAKRGNRLIVKRA